MHLELSRRAVPFLMACLLIGFCFAGADAQKRRTKKSRRVTHPVTAKAQPTPTPSASTNDPKIISTADESAYDSGATTTGRRTRTRRNVEPQSEEVATREKVDRLTAEFSALNEKLSQMELQQRTLVDLERLSRAETRGENLRVQLRDVQAKEAELQARAMQLEYELQPTVIERTLASSGSTHPEDLREQRRRQLEAEKIGVQSQLTQLATGRARLETAIANADAVADRLRARIDTVLEPPTTETNSTDVGAQPETTTQSNETGEGKPR